MKQEEILAHARMYNQQKQAVEKEVEKLSVSLMELKNSVKTVKELEENAGLVPIGGGAFVHADLHKEKIVIPIGSGYAKEYTPEDADKEISKRVELTENALKKMRDELGKIDEQMAQLEKEYRKLNKE